MKVSKLMNKELVVAYGGDSVQKVADIMEKTNKGLVPVLDNLREKKVIGVVSNKDIINKVIAQKLSTEDISAAEIMTKEFIYLDPEDATSDAMTLMRDNNIKRVLIIQNGMLQGIISSNDILNAMIKYKKELLDLAIEF